MSSKKIGFIGQGYVGKNLADNLEKREFNIVRYSLEEKYKMNKEKIKECQIVFIAVPTPTSVGIADASIINESLKLVADGSIVCIKSTMQHWDLLDLQSVYTKLTILHSPEFLDENTAKTDTDNPKKNIIGIPVRSDFSAKEAAEEVMKILPKAPYEKICNYEDSTMIKYIHNSFFFIKNVFFNLAYDLAQKNGANWEDIREAVLSDPRITPIHTIPVDKGGRGAGGNCLPKDFTVFKEMFRRGCQKDKVGNAFLRAAEKRNLRYLINSEKSMDIVMDLAENNNDIDITELNKDDK